MEGALPLNLAGGGLVPRPRVAILFHRFGPYHVSRLDRAMGLLDLHGIELSATDHVYAWSRTDGDGSFPRRVVSRDMDRDMASTVVRQVADVLSDVAPDVVAIPGWSHRGALAALLWCMRSATPAIMMSESTERDLPRRPWQEAVKRRIVALCCSAFVGGIPHRDYLMALGMPAARIRPGYDVVDNDHFTYGSACARGNAAGERAARQLPNEYFLTVCRFVAEKNLFRLLEAYDRYRGLAGERAWPLVIIGDGPLRPAMEQMIAARGLEGHVRLAGFKQYQDLPAYYGLAGAFVLPSTTEPWGLVVNEAMAAGLPVIVSERCGCVEDVVAPGRNGFRFDPLDPEGLGRLLLHVASDHCDRARLGQESRAIIAAWTPERFASGLLEAALIACGHPPYPSVLDRCLVRALVERRSSPAKLA